MENASAVCARERSEGRDELVRTGVALALLLGLFAALAFAPRNDPARTVAGLPCSIVSENAVAQALGTPVRLMPSTGTICRYVSTGRKTQRSLYVVARHDDDPSLGDGTHRIGDSLYVRRGKRTYVFTAVGPSVDEPSRLAVERALEGAVARPVVARTR